VASPARSAEHDQLTLGFSGSLHRHLSQRRPCLARPDLLRWRTSSGHRASETGPGQGTFPDEGQRQVRFQGSCSPSRSVLHAGPGISLPFPSPFPTRHRVGESSNYQRPELTMPRQHDARHRLSSRIPTFRGLSAGLDVLPLGPDRLGHHRHDDYTTDVVAYPKQEENSAGRGSFALNCALQVLQRQARRLPDLPPKSSRHQPANFTPTQTCRASILRQPTCG